MSQFQESFHQTGWRIGAPLAGRPGEFASAASPAVKLHFCEGTQHCPAGLLQERVLRGERDYSTLSALAQEVGRMRQAAAADRASRAASRPGQP